MIILGINAYHADASAAIFVNGILVAAAEEERFTRVKHWAGFPAMAINFCLKEAKLQPGQVEYITFGYDPKAKLLRKILLAATSPLATLDAIKYKLSNKRTEDNIHNNLSQIGFKRNSKIVHVEHHRSHIASAFYASTFKEAALLSIDGAGDFTTTMTGIGKSNQITVLNSLDYPHSLGVFYTAFTQLLGFPFYGDEYKIMGLAPYGKPLFTKELADVLKLKSNGLFQLNLHYFRSPAKGFVSYNQNLPIIPLLYSPKLVKMFGMPRTKDEPISQYHKDLAASVQKVTEETIFHLLEHLYKKTHLDKICIAGGVAQNSVANGKITRNTPFKEVFIPPAGHDAGISMGSALYLQHHILNYPRNTNIASVYTGSSFTNDEIENLLKQENITYTQYTEESLYEVVTTALINAAVVGWFSGKAEFGPRALGGRSILADPRRSDAKELLNNKIKRRESFRPFAPSILKEYISEYFEVNDTVPYMEKVFPIKKDKQQLIPAVTHVDGTGRLQTVDKDMSPRYYQLIDSFRKKTGIPILLNTSFNENEPIVNTPMEALNCFLRTDMDMLVIENFVIQR